MPEIDSISWQSITGNKFRKDLRPEMFSEKGCVLQQKVRPIGVGLPSLYNVCYDREYGLQFLLRKICRSLSALGREKVHELIDDAWDLYDKETLTPEPSYLRNN